LARLPSDRSRKCEIPDQIAVKPVYCRSIPGAGTTS